MNLIGYQFQLQTLWLDMVLGSEGETLQDFNLMKWFKPTNLENDL